MKKHIIQFSAIALLFISCSHQGNSDFSEINNTVISFVKAGDQRDAEMLRSVLHPEFRTLANRFFGGEELQVLSKDVYLKLIDDGTIGGDDRKVEISNTEVIGHNAYVRATFTGNEYKFNTFVLLAQNTEGRWKVVSDMPFVEKVP